MDDPRYVALCAALLISSIFDLRHRRIPNGLIAAGMFFGIAIGMWFQGIDGLMAWAGGFVVGILVLMPFFALRFMGGGDVKLMGVVGGLVGAPAVIPIALYTFIAGGVLAVIAIVATRSTALAADNLRAMVLSFGMRTTQEPGNTAPRLAQTAHRLPYALAIALGALTWLSMGG